MLEIDQKREITGLERVASYQRSTMYMEHWNMKVSSFPRSDPSNMLGLLGLTQDLGSAEAGGGGTESVARRSVMAQSVSANWVWYWKCM